MTAGAFRAASASFVSRSFCAARPRENSRTRTLDKGVTEKVVVHLAAVLDAIRLVPETDDVGGLESDDNDAVLCNSRTRLKDPMLESAFSLGNDNNRPV